MFGFKRAGISFNLHLLHTFWTDFNVGQELKC